MRSNELRRRLLGKYVNIDCPIIETPFSAGLPGERGRGLQRLIGVILLLIISVAVVLLCPSSTYGQDVAKEAFSEKKFPWYDSESDSVKRVELGNRPGIRSTKRNAIPIARGTTRPASNRKLNNASSFFEGLGVLAWILIGLVIASVVAVLVWAFLRMEDVKTQDVSVPRRTMEESIKQLPFELDIESGDFRLAAQKAFLANDYRNAIIFLFSHVLVSLDQKNVIRLRKGKTNRQYLNELRGHRTLANYYQRVMVPFEATFFGDHDLGKQEFEHCWNHLDLFQKDVEQAQVANV